MLDESGRVLTQHSLNRVPFIVASKDLEGQTDRLAEQDRGLADIAPTVLTLLGLPVPEEMTGRSII
jgi:2,3-bisphosphoglycerate-independent phosphoglycerate mutase